MWLNRSGISMEGDMANGWHKPFEWKDDFTGTPLDRVRVLAALRLSTSRIASILASQGFERSRCAIISRARDNKIPLHGGNGGENKRERKRPPMSRARTPPKKPVDKTPIALVVVEPEPTPVMVDGTWMTLEHSTDTMCPWLIGDPLDPDSHVCGHKKPKRQPYCDLHQRKAHLRRKVPTESLYH